MASADQLYTGQRLNVLSHLYHYNSGKSAGRFYDPLLARFVMADPVTPPGSQGLNRYSHTFNNPIKYTDPDGHCPMCVTAALGAAAGAGIAYGSQVVANVSRDGVSGKAFSDVSWSAVGAGAVAGAVGGATFGVGTAVMGTGFAATVGTGAVSGALAGQAGRAADNVLSGRDATEGLGNVGDMAMDAALGAGLAGAAQVAGQAMKAGVAATAQDMRYVPARHLRFTQDSIGPNTKAGVPLDMLTQEIDNGYFRGTLRVVEYRGKLWSLDNRRLAAFRLLDRDVPVTVEDLNDPAVYTEFLRKLTTPNEGLSIGVRGADLVIE